MIAFLKKFGLILVDFVAWVITRTSDERDRALKAEIEAKETQDSLTSQQERQRDHEKRMEEIRSGDLSESRINELLGSYPEANISTLNTINEKIQGPQSP